MVFDHLKIKNSDSEGITSVAATCHHENLEPLARLACTAHLLKIEKAIAAEAPAIHDKQDSIRLYNQIQKRIDMATEANHELNISKFNTLIEEIQADIKAQHADDIEKNPQANERLQAQFERRMAILDEVSSMSSEMNKNGGNFSSEQRMRLIKSLESEIGDLNLQINMDLQKLKKYYEHHNLAYQFATTISKTLDQMNKNAIRSINLR